jgi:sporulation protein YlmC with PRC-barrel domain
MFMKRKMMATALLAMLSTAPALAQAPAVFATVSPQSMTINHWYKQNVYDNAGSKIGDIQDVLLTADGKAEALVVGVGGFLGMGEKDVAIPFSAIKRTSKDGKDYLTLDTTKDALKAAPGVSYDRSTMVWAPETKK